MVLGLMRAGFLAKKRLLINLYDFYLLKLRIVINLRPILSHGVMVTLRFLVSSF